MIQTYNKSLTNQLSKKLNIKHGLINRLKVYSDYNATKVFVYFSFFHQGIELIVFAGNSLALTQRDLEIEIDNEINRFNTYLKDDSLGNYLFAHLNKIEIFNHQRPSIDFEPLYTKIINFTNSFGQNALSRIKHIYSHHDAKEFLLSNY